MLFGRSGVVAQSLSPLSFLAPPPARLKNQGVFMCSLIFTIYLAQEFDAKPAGKQKRMKTKTAALTSSRFVTVPEGSR